MCSLSLKIDMASGQLVWLFIQIQRFPMGNIIDISFPNMKWHFEYWQFIDLLMSEKAN